MARLVVAIVIAHTCKVLADPSGEWCGTACPNLMELGENIALLRAKGSADPPREWCGTVCPNFRHPEDQMALMLIQTDLKMSIKPASAITVTGGGMRKEAEGMHGNVITRMWQWVSKASQLEEKKNDAMEAAKRFHKDFIAAALIMACVFPWSSPAQSTEDSSQEGQSRLWRMLPSGLSLRVLCVLLLWMNHYWFRGHQALEMALVLVGVVFDFVNQHADCEDDMWKKLSEFIPDQFARLYPFYTLFVIVCYLVFFSTPFYGNENLFGGCMMLTRTLSLGAWLLSVVFGCYLVLPVLANPPDHIESSAKAMICAGCVAMIVLPRTLAAPVHSPWVWSEEQDSMVHMNPDSVSYELFFARRSLLIGLAHFFFGLVLARARLFSKLSWFFVTPAVSNECKESSIEISSCVGRENQSAGQRDADLWKAFEDEAKREMLRSLSFNN